MIKRICIALFFIGIFVSCSKDEKKPPFPIIETTGSQVFSSGGVKLEGNIRNLGDEEIRDYGFELYTNGGNIYYNVNHHADLPARSGVFSLDIKQGLYPDLEYTYTAYIRTDKDTYKGERLVFQSRGSSTPILQKCIPNIAHIGDTIVLSGKNFPTNKNDIEFKYKGAYAEIITAKEDEIEFKVPYPSNNGNLLEMEAYNKKVSEDALLSLHNPIISNISPDTIFIGDTITIEGDHFNLEKQFTNVEIGGIRAELLSTSRKKIEVVVPKEVEFNNSPLILFAQYQYVNYDNFLITQPKFTYTPNEVYTYEYFDIKVNRTYEGKTTFFIDSNEYHPEIIDNETLRFYLYTSSLFDQRENHIKWKINDLEVLSEAPIKINNPFYKIKYGHFLFDENYQVFNIENEVMVIGLDVNADERRYLYKYNDVLNEWNKAAMLNINGNPIALGPPSSSGVKYTYSKYDNAIYGLNQTQYGNNFFKVNISNGSVTYLPSNHNSSFYGQGFAYNNKVFFLSGLDNKVWCFNIDNNTWSNVAQTPFEKGNYRELYIDVSVIGNFVYFLNGSDGSLYNDFWRMNLNSYQWEKLPDNPEPKKFSTSFLFNDELYSITESAYKYNFSTGLWEQVDKPGTLYNFGADKPANSFLQNNIPDIIIKHDVASNVTYLSLFKGDLLNK